MNPTNQFIQIAPDCLLKTAIIPQSKADKLSFAMIEYALLSSKPYCYVLDELQFEVYLRHKQVVQNSVKQEPLKTQRQLLWDAFFSKPHACMRASPLTKKYGWGVHYDVAGKIALVAIESKDYQRFVDDNDIKKYFAMRSSR